MRCIHRDIKPGNFILSKKLSCMLTDFGACVQMPASGNARCETDDTTNRSGFTNDSGCANSDLPSTENVSEERNIVKENEDSVYLDTDLVGTIDHMAPELIESDSSRQKVPYSFSSDVYALGVVICSVLAMKSPYEGLGGFKIKALVLEGTRPTIVPCPPTLRRILEECFSHNPLCRPDASEVLRVLEDLGT
mmetsp:Transcript_16261/g.19744  ORF Transcript_16261/g.19744 Transcript_16261/m.19744 type:complete len:192 (+) Transcript_16261:964-1539(+)